MAKNLGFPLIRLFVKVLRFATKNKLYFGFLNSENKFYFGINPPLS